MSRDLPDRPARKMPSLKQIARHWERDDEDILFCWRCERTCKPERAHIIDRCYGGLDGPQNLWLLCSPCHYEQPNSRPENWWHTMAYMTGIDEWSRLAVCAFRICSAATPRNLWNPTCICEDLTEDQYLKSLCWNESDFNLARSGNASIALRSLTQKFVSQCASCRDKVQ